MIANETPQETKITQKLTTIGHRTAFNNKQSPYRIVRYKRHEITWCKANEKTNGLINVQKMSEKQNM